MAKEINEQPDAVADTMLGAHRRRGPPGARRGPHLEELFGGIERIIIVACGTAAYAGMVGKYAIEQWARVPVEVELAHEFRYRDPIGDARTLVVSISQSGETMDTLMAVKYARELGARTLSICNTHGATIPRESDAVVYTHAGPRGRGGLDQGLLRPDHRRLPAGSAPGPDARWRTRGQRPGGHARARGLPDKIRRCSTGRTGSSSIAHWMADTRSVLFLGRHVGYPIALEGALKLKELAYIHAEGFAAGELKHGPIALIEPGQPVFVIVPSPREPRTSCTRRSSRTSRRSARAAPAWSIAEEGDAAVLPFADEVLRIPRRPLFEPLLTVVPLHIFAMGLATAKGLDVDQPRNLAKSVTVE